MARRALIASMITLLAACAVSPRSASAPVTATSRMSVELPATASQGALAIGRAPANAHVRFAGRDVRVAPDGHFALGIARDASGRMPVSIDVPGSLPETIGLQIVPRDWPIEHVNGVPPATVNPPPAIAARIEAEQARVAAVRTRDDERVDFLQRFQWPVQGRISGRFGNQRVYNGSAGAPHSGMDIAAATGTPVHAPAAGTITFADPDLYLTGGTVVLDHGHGVSSNFLHLSRIDVHVGDRVAQGQVIGAVGSTGRATGPHLHWGMNWFDVRIDPLLLVDAPAR
ncbi:M23 family metallopeptidase [Lysobacter sp. HA35]